MGFEVSATGQALSYQWLRDGTPIPGATEASYALSSVTLSDDGAEFSVVVTNVAGSVTSQVATLQVQLAAPVITDVSAEPDRRRRAARNLHRRGCGQ